MEYTKQQQEALQSIDSFLNGKDSIFILKGYAGTGKTTLIKPIIELAKSHDRSIQLLAPTGRAAKIIADKTENFATTIHSAIYSFKDIEVIDGDENNESSVKYRFPLRPQQNSKDGVDVSPEKFLMVIDESSMISSKKVSQDLLSFGSGVLLNDLIQYSKLELGGKIIFIGDPAQLPPVKESDSVALNVELLREKGYGVSSYELTDVVRQQADSVILKNSIKLRLAISSSVKQSFLIERKIGEVEDISYGKILEKYFSISKAPSLNGPIIICYANKTAAAYNYSIRKYFFPSNFNSINVGDKLIVVGNNYCCSGARCVLNGELAVVIKCSDNIEVQTGYVYKNVGYGQKKPFEKVLTFRDVVLQFENGAEVKTKIFDFLLNSTNPNLDYDEQCALMSNFRIRHKNLDVKSSQYVEELTKDPYYNALRVKYGYAITCHKAQGGEWETVFVDFSRRRFFNKNALRWAYTAITRSRKMLYGYLLNSVG